MADAHPDPVSLGLAPRESSGIRTTFRESVEYALGGFAYKAVAFLSVPILARVLLPAQLGLLDVAVLIALVVSVTASAGLENAVARLDAVGADAGELWASAGTIVLGGAVLLGVAGFLLANPISRLLTGSDVHADVVVAGVVYGCVLTFSLTAQNAIRVRRRPRRYAAYGFAIVVGEMAAALSLAVAGASVPIIVLGWTFASAIGAAVLIALEVPRPSAPSAHTIRRLLAYGIPLVPATLVWIIGDLGVRGIVAHEATIASLGLFGLATRLTSPIQLLVVGFGLAWHPFIYTAAAGRTRDLAVDAATRLAAALGVVAILLTVLAPELVAVIAGPGYEGAVNVVPGLAAGMVLFGLITLSTAVLGAGYRLGPVVAASIGGAALQVAAAWFLVPSFGFAVAGLSVALGYALTAALLTIRAGVFTGAAAVQLGSVAAGLVLGHLALDSALPARLAVGVIVSGVVILTWFLMTRAARTKADSR